ncbi:Double Zinc Ribbon And Ankyrin Repeat-Containing Protein 1 [Manis pentadactyla]|nr:Double Zinc Ribbon And Ankyrin Repeat-Containing Protein 1 [Manis pentadactyla]
MKLVGFFLLALFQPNVESPERVAKRSLAGALISWTVRSSGFPVCSRMNYAKIVNMEFAFKQSTVHH